ESTVDLSALVRIHRMPAIEQEAIHLGVGVTDIVRGSQDRVGVEHGGGVGVGAQGPSGQNRFEIVPVHSLEERRKIEHLDFHLNSESSQAVGKQGGNLLLHRLSLKYQQREPER